MLISYAHIMKKEAKFATHSQKAQTPVNPIDQVWNHYNLKR